MTTDDTTDQYAGLAEILRAMDKVDNEAAANKWCCEQHQKEFDEVSSLIRGRSLALYDIHRLDSRRVDMALDLIKSASESVKACYNETPMVHSELETLSSKAELETLKLLINSCLAAWCCYQHEEQFMGVFETMATTFMELDDIDAVTMPVALLMSATIKSLEAKMEALLKAQPSEFHKGKDTEPETFDN